MSFRDSDPEVYTMNADGTGQTRLTFNVGPSPELPLLDFWPSWSSDGTKIVYTSFRVFGPGEVNGDIYTMNPDGSGQTRITTDPAGDLDPAFSPGQAKIVFVREVPGPSPGDAPAAQDIYTVNVDGTGETNLTPGPERETEPAISPDGTKIVFEREVDPATENHEIFTMNVDGTGLKRLTNTTAAEGHPNFFPDGTRIIFDDNFHADTAVAGVIRTMNAADGSDVRTLTANRTDRHGLAGYSPDGTKIAFTASEDIWVMDVDGSNQKPLTSDPAADIQSSWQPVFRAAPTSPALPAGVDCPKGSSRGVRCTGRTASGGYVIVGTSGGDTIVGSCKGDVINGGGGDDDITGDPAGCANARSAAADKSQGGGNGADRINGNGGNDTIRGVFGRDSISGSSGRDRVNGGTGSDKINSGSGKDSVKGSSGSDRINGSSGNDRLNGSSGNDRLNGSSGNDRLSGGSGNDALFGNSGRDRLSGNSGRDRLLGGSGKDKLSGGPGRDKTKQ